MSDATEHRIIVDDNITVTMKIPTELDALSLRGLMLKAQRLLNLSEVTVKPQQKKASGKVRMDWTEAKKNELLKVVKEHKTKTAAFEAFAEKHNTTVRAGAAMYHAMKG